MVGLMDRVHALGGRIELTSPAGEGTTLLVTIPLRRAEQDPAAGTTAVTN